MKKIIKGILMVTMVFIFGVMVTSNNGMAADNKKALKEYSKQLADSSFQKEFKSTKNYFGVVDINKDGVDELLLSKNSAGNKMITVASYAKGIHTWYTTSVTKPIYYNTGKKGILISYPEVVVYYEMFSREYKAYDGNYKIQSPQGHIVMYEKSDKKYHYYWGDLSYETLSKEKKMNKSQCDSFLEKQSWAFTEKDRGTMKVKFYKNNAANRKKLAQGKF